MDETEARYMHLLQPIRDMTKNWEVDVAAQLGEYMHELDQICISFDGGKTTMNFAEAALLIQGSACIYSKKVEYLYSLVYQALDFISNKKRDKQPASVGVDGVDKDATFAHRNEEEEVMFQNSYFLMYFCLQVVDIVPLTPVGLVPPEEAEKKDNPLYSRKGEILASCKDFRMNTYTPHANGAFVLDLAGVSPTREFLREGNASGAGDNDCDDGDAGDAFLQLTACNGMEVDPSPSEHVERRQVSFTGDIASACLDLLPDKNPQDYIKLLKEFLDPWRSLDPFSNSEDKPFKKGKHFTIPRCVEETTGNSRKRKGPTKLQDFRKWFSGTYYEGADVKGKKKGPTFADMEVLYWKHMKERLVAQKKIQKKMGILFSNEIAEHHNKDLENAEEQNEVEDNRHDDYLDNDGGDDFSDHENLAQDFPVEILDEERLAATEPQEERPSYEDLVRRNVDLFIANSQKYARETVLSIRVRDWEDKMGPQLTEQEERVAFDIHDYGDKIVDAFSQVGERRTFASIVRGKEAFEVCRYKLASLQLANDCTVKIDKKPGLYESIDSMELTLLSKQRAHERFQTYAAPSLTDF
ncbi:CNDH2 protein, partial [Polyodon spathula]|nr:CNDH2 protein [Polyodon spathula]